MTKGHAERSALALSQPTDCKNGVAVSAYEKNWCHFVIASDMHDIRIQPELKVCQPFLPLCWVRQLLEAEDDDIGASSLSAGFAGAGAEFAGEGGEAAGEGARRRRSS